jgi:hypothetical protein
MKNKLFTLAGAFTLAAVIGSIYAAPALAQVIKAALVKNIDEPGRSPYTVRLACLTVSSLQCVDSSTTTIPMGKRFVVQYVTAFSESGSSTDGFVHIFSFNGGSGELLRQAHVPMPISFVSGVLKKFVGSAPVTCFFDEGLTVQAQFFLGTSGDGSVVINGYLVNLAN